MLLLFSWGTIVAAKSVQLGQVWRSDLDGQNYLITKVYNEVFTQYAMLRPAEKNAPDADTVRVRVVKTTAGATLPGYTFTQDGAF
ncbi:MAG: hypothetical protein DMG68_01600 [Acidobacteria bacterium]|nr:MAG: hypothetical protein DMG68_01600 [Acidobacteriota bacterium]